MQREAETTATPQKKPGDVISFPDGKVGIADYAKAGSQLLIVGQPNIIRKGSGLILNYKNGKDIFSGQGVHTSYLQGVMFNTKKGKAAFGCRKDARHTLVRVECPIGTDVSTLKSKSMHTKSHELNGNKRVVHHFVIPGMELGLHVDYIPEDEPKHENTAEASGNEA